MRVKILNVIGTILLAINQWVQIILITRLLGLYEVGLFSYFLALLGPFVLFSRFMLSVLVPTQRKLAYDYAVFHQFRNMTNYAFVLCAVVLMITVDLSIYESICLFIFVIFKFYENKEEFIYTENIAESRISFLAYSKIYKSILTILLFAGATITFQSLIAAIASLLISQVIIYYLYDLKFSFSEGRVKPRMTSRAFRNIFYLGIGLSIVEVLNSLVSNIPRYMIEHFHSIETLGIFATIMYFATITNNVVVAICESVVAALSRDAENSIRRFGRSFVRLCGIFLVLIIIGEIILLSFGTDIIVFVYGDQFIGYQYEIVLLGILLFFTVYTKLFEMALSIFNIYNLQVVLQGVTFIATGVFSIAVIIPYGLPGAFIVAIITQVILISGQLVVLLYHWKYKVGT
ncbi:lipopolysaccharide biosynthesis protein [Salinicoccus albus]|uniref:lipopolysaccharide biosynthesis protein n=1 Tax=Salinicoccus albus TaxID=418756 RepID=UPI0003656E48|nr:oligosaccharide flippase family protein [Salinicoccus albus]